MCYLKAEYKICSKSLLCSDILTDLPKVQLQVAFSATAPKKHHASRGTALLEKFWFEYVLKLDVAASFYACGRVSGF
jgi:cell fate regulator YaaT (PSP1 superfamily)